MTGLLITAVAWLLNLIIGSLTPYVNIMIGSLTEYGLRLGKYIDDWTNTSLCETLQQVFTTFGLSFLTLAFLKKGFEEYVTYTDGDPDSDPFQLLTLYFKAIAIIAATPILIEFFTDIADSLIQDAIGAIASANGTVGWDTNLKQFKFSETDLSGNLLAGIGVIIYFVIVIIFQISMVGTGLEFLILQIGLPIAAVGLLNADKGVFKSYSMSIAKVIVTVVVKVILCELSFVMVIFAGSFGSDNFFMLLIIAIACMLAAFKVPKMLAEWMIPSGGGQGIMMKAYYASNMVSKVAHFFKR